MHVLRLWGLETCIGLLSPAQLRSFRNARHFHLASTRKKQTRAAINALGTAISPHKLLWGQNHVQAAYATP
jgi:hypothetical protein